MLKLENEQSNYKVSKDDINDIFSGLDFETHTISDNDFLDSVKDSDKEDNK